MRSNHLGRIAYVTLAALNAGCGDSTGPGGMADGTYVVEITNAPFSAGDIPGWASGPHAITLRKVGGALEVLASSGDQVALGPPGILQVLEDGFNAHFRLRASLFAGAERNYFFAHFNGSVCFRGGARDNNRLRTYDGSCSVRRQ